MNLIIFHIRFYLNIIRQCTKVISLTPPCVRDNLFSRQARRRAFKRKSTLARRGISPDQLLLGESNFAVSRRHELSERGSDDKANCFWTTWPRATSSTHSWARMPRGKPPGQSWSPQRPIQTTPTVATRTNNAQKWWAAVPKRCLPACVFLSVFAQQQSASFITQTQLISRRGK